MIRRQVLAGFAALVVVAAVGGPVGAQQPAPPVIQPRIVGGSQSAPGQWPYQAALLRHGEPNTYVALVCGASVISNTWILTAAHCMFDPVTNAQRQGGDLDVLTGTNILGDGSGQRHQVAAVRVDPSYDPATDRNDIALVRLAHPTTAPAVAVVTPAQAALWVAGTGATVTGWGNTNAGARPSALRQVTVPIQSDATCEQRYQGTGGDEQFDRATMLCAGPLSGGQDSCQGDSGGPLVVPGPSGSGPVEVGVVSWGYGCAQAGYPGVYSRLAGPPLGNFIAQTKRFGPFDDSTAFVVEQYSDFNHRWPTSDELAVWNWVLGGVAPEELISALESSDTWQNHGWAVARLYRASFLRDPDTNGMTYWTNRSWQGSLGSIASFFTSSHEFIGRYGALDNGGFVDRVYQNVFGRAPDSSGRRYWIGRLNSGASRGDVMVGLSESHEYRTSTAARVRAITTWFALIRAVPTAAQITAVQSEPLAQLISDLRLGYTYASRF